MEVTQPVIFNFSLFTTNKQIAFGRSFFSYFLFLFPTLLVSTDVSLYRHTTETKRPCREHQAQCNFAKLTLFEEASDAKHFKSISTLNFQHFLWKMGNEGSSAECWQIAVSTRNDLWTCRANVGQPKIVLVNMSVCLSLFPSLVYVKMIAMQWQNTFFQTIQIIE